MIQNNGQLERGQLLSVVDRLHVSLQIITFFVLLGGLALIRLDAILVPQFWAEDGAEYFFGAFRHPFFFSCFHPYGGYFCLFQRFFASLTLLLIPLRCVPLVFNIFCMLVAAWACSLFSSKDYRYLIQSDWLRIWVCILIALFQPALEVPANLTNLHWYLSLGALLLLLEPLKSQRRTILNCCFVGVASLSAPTIVFLCPLALLILLFPGRPPYRAPAFTMIFATLAHLVAIVLTIGLRSGSYRISSVLELIEYSLNFLKVEALYLLGGYGGAREMFHQSALPYLVLATAAILLLFEIPRFGQRRLLWGLVVIGTLFLLIASTIFLRSTVVFTQLPSDLFLQYSNPNYENYTHSRYLFFPFCFLVFLIGAVFDQIEHAGFGRPIIAASLLVLFIQFSSLKSFGPLPDLNWPEYAAKIEKGWAVSVPIHPTAWGWTIEIKKATQKHRTGEERSLLEKLVSHKTDYVGIRLVNVDGAMREAFFQHPPSEVTVQILVSSPSLNFQYGFDERARLGSDGATFRIKLRNGKTKSKEIFARTLTPRTEPEHRKWIQGKVDLSAYLGKKVKLTFVTETAGNSFYDWVMWINPRLE